MKSRTMLTAALAIVAAATAFADAAHAQCGDSITAYHLVSLAPGQKARLIVLNAVDPGAPNQKAGSINVTLKFILYEPGQQVGPGSFRHSPVGERTSGEVALMPEQALSLDFNDPGTADTGVRAVRPALSFSSLPGGSAAPLKLTLEIIDAATGKTSAIMIDGADSECRR